MMIFEELGLGLSSIVSWSTTFFMVNQVYITLDYLISV